jgi:hypothetical protein
MVGVRSEDGAGENAGDDGRSASTASGSVVGLSAGAGMSTDKGIMEEALAESWGERAGPVIPNARATTRAIWNSRESPVVMINSFLTGLSYRKAQGFVRNSSLQQTYSLGDLFTFHRTIQRDV